MMFAFQTFIASLLFLSLQIWATPTPDSLPSFNSSSDLQPRNTGTIEAFLWVSDCSGTPDYTWSASQGCYSYNGNTDMYSINLSEDINIGCEFILFVAYHDNYDCSGTATFARGGPGCWGSSNSIKSFAMDCDWNIGRGVRDLGMIGTQIVIF